MKRIIAIVLFAIATAVSAMSVEQWAVFEASFTSAQKYDNSFTDVDVNVVFKQGDKQWKVPAFWAGDKKWTVRFAPPVQGKYTYHVECTDKTNPGLNGKEQTFSVAAYKGDNPLLKHGPLRATKDRPDSAKTSAMSKSSIPFVNKWTSSSVINSTGLPIARPFQ